MTVETLERLALRVDRDALLPVLKAADKVLAKRTNMPILSHFLLRLEENRLRITATDLDVSMEIEVEAACAAAAPVAVPGHIRDVVAKLADGVEISIEVVDDHSIALKAGRSRFVLPTLPAADFPDLSAGELPHQFEIPADELARAMDATAFAISTEETRYYLNGVYMQPVEEELVFVSTNGHQLARVGVTLPEGAAAMSGVIIPRLTVAEIRRLAGAADHAIRVEVSTTKIRVVSGSTTLTSKLIDGSFPDYQRVIPQGHDKSLTIDPKALSAAIDRVTTVAGDRSQGVKLSLSPNRVGLYSHNLGAGEAHDEIDGITEGAELEIGFSGRYLREILSAISASEVVIKLSDAGSPARIEAPARPGTVFVVMPMRI